MKIKWTPLSSGDGWKFHYRGWISGEYSAWIQRDGGCWMAAITVNGQSKYANFLSAASAKQWAKNQVQK